MPSECSALREQRARLTAHARERRIPDAVSQPLQPLEDRRAAHMLARRAIDQPRGDLRLLDNEVLAREEGDHLTIGFRLREVPQRLLCGSDHPAPSLLNECGDERGRVRRADARQRTQRLAYRMLVANPQQYAERGLAARTRKPQRTSDEPLFSSIGTLDGRREAPG